MACALSERGRRRVRVRPVAGREIFLRLRERACGEDLVGAMPVPEQESHRMLNVSSSLGSVIPGPTLTLEATMDLIEILARAIIRSQPSELPPDDLSTWDPDIPSLTGVHSAGVVPL